MVVTLKYVFNDFEQAEAVAKMLRSQKATAVKMISLADETGGVEGNFILEYKDEPENSEDRLSSGAPFDPNINKGLGRQPIVHNDKVLLVVKMDAHDKPGIHKLMTDARGVQMD